MLRGVVIIWGTKPRGLRISKVVIVLIAFNLRGCTSLGILVRTTSRIVIESRYHSILVPIIVLERIQILPVDCTFSLSHLTGPLQSHASLLLTVKIFFVFPLLL